MEPNKTTLERTFELARSGQFTKMEELRTRLKSDGYNVSQLEGRSLLKQLKEILKTACRDI